MKLEIGNFYVKDIVFGDKTSYADGILTINKQEALELVREDEHITEADLKIVKPGDKVRLVPVKEAIEPRIKINGDPLFPGFTGELAKSGDGRTHALKDCSVLIVGQHWGGWQDGLLDMSGPGAEQSLFSQLKHIVLVGDTDEDFEKREIQKKNWALRKAGHRLAEYIGAAVKDLEPEELETYELESVTKRSKSENDLPNLVFVMQAASQMEEWGYNDLVYGWDMNHTVPTFLHPNEVLDGAMVGGSMMCSSSKWATYNYQNFTIIKKLYAEHGKSFNFLGVILTNTNVKLIQKERSALFVAQIAKSLGADCAVVALNDYGNANADFIGCCVALEDADIKTVGTAVECSGRDGKSQPLVVLDEKVDAIVTPGNVSELIELPPMETVIGELESLARDGFAGGWGCDEKLGPSVREDGSIIMEDNSIFLADYTDGGSIKAVKEF